MFKGRGGLGGRGWSKVAYVLVQKEVSQRKSDRQEAVHCKEDGQGSIAQSLTGLQSYNQRKSREGENDTFFLILE